MHLEMVKLFKTMLVNLYCLSRPGILTLNCLLSGAISGFNILYVD